MSELTGPQKQKLALLARNAFNKLRSITRGRDDTFDDSAAAFAEWRHEQVAIACGKSGLRGCDQKDFKAVEARFLFLLGRDVAAFHSNLRHQSEPARQLRVVIAQACERWGFNMNYATWICRTIHKVRLEDASEDVLKKVLFTVNSRGRAKHKKEQEAA